MIYCRKELLNFYFSKVTIQTQGEIPHLFFNLLRILNIFVYKHISKYRASKKHNRNSHSLKENLSKSKNIDLQLLNPLIAIYSKDKNECG